MLSNFLRIRFINNLALRLGILFHNFSYRFIPALATLNNNGIHLKYRITNYHKFFFDNVNEKDVVLDIGCGLVFLLKKGGKRNNWN